MVAIFVALIFGYYATQFYAAILDTQALNQALLLEENTEKLARLSVALEDFGRTFDAYPADLAALASVAGFDWVGPLATPRVRYAVANNLSSGQILFTRAALVYQREADTLDDIDEVFDDANVCGGDFSAASEWCLGPRANWWRGETRDLHIRRQFEIRRQLNRTLYKFLAYYQGRDAFPRNTSADATRTIRPGITLNPGDSFPLRELVLRLGASVVGTSGTTCNGVFDFDGITLECDDLYSPQSGAPLMYSYQADTNVAFTVSSGVLSAGGTPILIAQELIL